VTDSRESPAIDVAQLLVKRGAIVSYSDPFIPRYTLGDLQLEAVTETAALDAGIDCAVVTTHHRAFDYDALVARAPLIVDTRNALKGRREGKIFRL